jgi:hypothetical protein
MQGEGLQCRASHARIPSDRKQGAGQESECCRSQLVENPLQDFSRRQAVELWQTDGMDLRCREAGFAVLVHKLRMLNVAWIRLHGSRCHLAL